MGYTLSKSMEMEQTVDDIKLISMRWFLARKMVFESYHAYVLTCSFGFFFIFLLFIYGSNSQCTYSKFVA